MLITIFSIYMLFFILCDVRGIIYCPLIRNSQSICMISDERQSDMTTSLVRYKLYNAITELEWFAKTNLNKLQSRLAPDAGCIHRPHRHLSVHSSDRETKISAAKSSHTVTKPLKLSSVITDDRSSCHSIVVDTTDAYLLTDSKVQSIPRLHGNSEMRNIRNKQCDYAVYVAKCVRKYSLSNLSIWKQ